MKVKIRESAQQPGGHAAGCLVCGKPVSYSTQSAKKTCAICRKTADSNAECIDGHFVCDTCHSAGAASLIPLFLKSDEKSPVKLLQTVFEQPQTHMHGPEHHTIVACVLLTACRNNGGTLDLQKALGEAVKRGAQVPGGTCGFWGACGAAISAGIYASVITGSTPYNKAVWYLPQLLTSECLSRIAKVGGPRCCKRTSRIAVDTAIAFTRERLGVSMPEENMKCTFFAKNKECLKGACPYF